MTWGKSNAQSRDYNISPGDFKTTGDGENPLENFNPAEPERCGDLGAAQTRRD